VSSFLSYLVIGLALIHPGANREIKKAVEAYWAGKLSADDLAKAASEVKKTSWTSVHSKGVDYVPR
jgi:5-methyltetrahydropteroyltriglutamate--homocysteine methyltransferase